MAKPYVRKVSTEEAREQYLLVTKDRLGYFPLEGEEFTLRRDGRGTVARVESYDCECRGPDTPHQHWFLRWPGLTAGEVVEITDDGSHYTARVS